MRRALRTLPALLLLVLAAAAASAQALDRTTPTGDGPAGADESRHLGPELPGATNVGLSLAGAVDASTYRVGPGDVLRLSIAGPLTQDVYLVVGPEGTLVLPGAGTVSVRDLTLAQTRTLVIDRLRRDIRGAQLDLRLERPRSFRVYLTGRVKKPGPQLVSATSRVADVLSPDLLEEDASRRAIRLEHTDGTASLADLGLFLETGDASGSPYLRDGDVVHVPVASHFVYAGGAVARPGRYELADGDSLATLLRRAGGLLPDAVGTRLLWLHWGQAAGPDSEWVSVAEAAGAARPLATGDRIYVFFVPNYRLQREVIILGEVGRPGAYPIVEGRTRLSDVVALAGSFLPAADLSAIRVHRLGATNGEPDPELDRMLRLSRGDMTASEYELLRAKLAARREDYRVNWPMLQHHPESLDLALRDGDVVRVDRLVSSIRVDGEVRDPAILTYRPGATVREYVREAGGFTNRAWVGKVRITRAVNGQTLLARNVDAVGPGDFVWVPERPDLTIWQQAGLVLTALAQAATIVIAIRSVK